MGANYQTAVVLLVFGALAYGCANPQPGTRNPTADAASINIDKSGLTPLSAPLTIGMKPTKAVDYTIIIRSPHYGGYQFVTSGRTQFERNPEGRLVQYGRFRSGALENPSSGDRVTFPLSIETAYEFDIEGEIWLIREPVISLPTSSPTARIGAGDWASFRDEVYSSYSLKSGDAAFECANQVFGLSGKSITTGYPMGPQNLEQFIDRLSLCTLAAIRGGDPFDDPDYRASLLAASPNELKQMQADMEETYRDQFSTTLKYQSDLSIRGSVVERGQEFLLAEGTTIIEFKGVKIESETSALVDPFTGLPYKGRNRVMTTGAPNESADADLVAEMNGMELAYEVDLPQAVPPVIAVSEPKPVVVTSSGAGSLSDMYDRSIGAVYLVVAGTQFGTGFAVSPTEAITSAHVVRGQKAAVLADQRGRKIDVTVVAVDLERDIALLRLNSGQFAVSLRVSSDYPATGAQVAVIGCPFDPTLCGTLTTGIVSFSNRPVDGISHIQVDAAINEGNSGGPILNLNGEVIGIAEFKVADPNFVGLSFGLASTEIRQFLTQQQVVVSALPAELFAQ